MDERAADIEALLEREFWVGTRVINCIPHMHLDLELRPADCQLCLSDLRNHFSLAVAANKWLNDWKEEATRIFKET